MTTLPPHHRTQNSLILYQKVTDQSHEGLPPWARSSRTNANCEAAVRCCINGPMSKTPLFSLLDAWGALPPAAAYVRVRSSWRSVGSMPCKSNRSSSWGRWQAARMLSLDEVYLRTEHESAVASRRQITLNTLENISTRLERTIGAAQMAGQGVAAMVRVEPDLTEAEFTAKD